MKNKKLIVLMGMLLMGLVIVSTVFAEGLKTGVYSINGSNLRFRFHNGGNLQVTFGDKPNSVLATARYSISGTRLIIVFGEIGNADLRSLSGRTFVYTIVDDETFAGYDEEWVRIGN